MTKTVLLNSDEYIIRQRLLAFQTWMSLRKWSHARTVLEAISVSAQADWVAKTVTKVRKKSWINIIIFWVRFVYFNLEFFLTPCLYHPNTRVNFVLPDRKIVSSADTMNLIPGKKSKIAWLVSTLITITPYFVIQATDPHLTLEKRKTQTKKKRKKKRYPTETLTWSAPGHPGATQATRSTKAFNPYKDVWSAKGLRCLG